MEESGNKARGEGAPASRPQSGPRRVHDHPAGPSKLSRSVMDLKAETFFLCFKLMLPLRLPFRKPQTQHREEAWGNGQRPGLESGDWPQHHSAANSLAGMAGGLDVHFAK